MRTLVIEMIRAGTIAELRRDSGDWVFVDVGFSQNARSCGFLSGQGDAVELTFADLVKHGRVVMTESELPLNLVIEAPLSVAFTATGNPTGRSFEKRTSGSRYWYVGLGCGVLVAALYFLNSLAQEMSSREVRLFEGFASFKVKGAKSSHTADVLKLRDVVWRPKQHPKAILAPDQLARTATDVVLSAFEVAGRNYGVPPVIVIDG